VTATPKLFTTNISQSLKPGLHCDSKKRHWCCTLQLQRTSTYFDNF